VLEAAGLRDLFDARVNGNVAQRKKLAGKPAPDTFEEAARSLGVARGEHREALREGGADVVVGDLAELELS
jgi:beta-phosphoglucomutase-like phosphatase (HAD superfamily)